ncbi:uncharacterized protein NEMAJ01_1115 [Nematocida major]|uniref:uncharacterized protein n=1 Tax=Nematocida major TaxID=1912982 RepID=UPI0020076488|nr:uncharacterized protein NEMAJ01_1115 [Nematocida major]KAH9386219.1 hypothetical protein NEMAJ01_1115 [Nematocida major]
MEGERGVSKKRKILFVFAGIGGIALLCGAFLFKGYSKKKGQQAPTSNMLPILDSSIFESFKTKMDGEISDSLKYTKPSIADMKKEIKRVHDALQSKNMWEFIVSLRKGARAKMELLTEIYNNPKDYKYFRNTDTLYRETIRQMMAFIERQWPEVCYSDKPEKFTLGYSHINYPISAADIFLKQPQYERLLDDTEKLNIKIQGRSQEHNFLCTAVEMLMSIPEVFLDLIRIDDEFLFVLRKNWIKRLGNFKLSIFLDHCLKRNHIKPEVKIQKDENFLVYMVESMARLAKYHIELKADGSDTAALLSEMEKTVEELHESLVKFIEIHYLGPLSTTIVYKTLFSVLTVFYEACPYVYKEKEIEGKKVVLPRRFLKSVFSIDGLENTLEYIGEPECSLITNDQMTLNASNKDFQLVYYVDNQDQMQKPVLIPMYGYSIEASEIAKYISALYRKLPEKIHLLGYSPTSCKWTYRDPHSVMFTGTNSSNIGEILVFYYIAESHPKDEEQIKKEAKMTPEEKKKMEEEKKKKIEATGIEEPEHLDLQFTELSQEGSETSRPGMVNFPLFLNKLFVSMLDSAKYEFNPRYAQDSVYTLKRFGDVNNIAPCLFVCNSESSFAYSNLCFDPTANSPENGGRFMLISNVIKTQMAGTRANPQYATMITYYTPDFEVGQYYNLYPENLKAIGLSISNLFDPLSKKAGTEFFKDYAIKSAIVSSPSGARGACLISNSASDPSSRNVKVLCTDEQAASELETKLSQDVLTEEVNTWELELAILHPVRSTVPGFLGLRKYAVKEMCLDE